ncbi:MAG: iron-sulfur cluster-binding domain-containing protein [Deltaproteobacteria bacterium]|nr:iron-sulfur cluster-binding domain-containing protein [Deltaproteobacteria bacterium]
MRLRSYLRLLEDARPVVRTLRQAYGTPQPSETPPYEREQARQVTDRLHPGWIVVRVVRIRVETLCTRTLVLKARRGALPAFAPGQYVNVFVEVRGVRTSRPMSISAPPRADGTMELTIKRKPGGFVSEHLVDHLKVGDALAVSGPEGDLPFQPARDGKDLVFIAAGSGVTPFMGMLEDLARRWPEVRLALLYGSRTAEAIIFRDRLEALARRGRLRLRHAVSRPSLGWAGERGRIDPPMLRRFLHGESLDGKTFFVCGPPELDRTVTRALEAAGVPGGRIRAESSGSPEAITGRSDWPVGLRANQVFMVRIEGHAAPIAARAGEPLLSSLERAGLSVPVLCRSGVCGSCRTRLTEGAVVRSVRAGQRASESAAGYIHACVSHPVSDLRVALLPASPRVP